jgi:hypothetical protein
VDFVGSFVARDRLAGMTSAKALASARARA